MLIFGEFCAILWNMAYGQSGGLRPGPWVHKYGR